jgi:Zn-dependent membrane protease YugP
MIVFFLLAAAAAAIYAPHLWAKHVLAKHSYIREGFPGTGIELARHLVDRLGIDGVRVEGTDLADHYDPLEKTVRLNRLRCGNKSLTAVVVAVHEVGHALQDSVGYRPLHLRTIWVSRARIIEKMGAALMLAIPVFAGLTRAPSVGLLTFLGGLISLGFPVVVHMLTLPVEWDASFKRALPILERNLPREDLPAARSILKACALTYVAASLASLLNLYRWIRILRR